MKHLFTFLAAFLITMNVFAQMPDKISYQAVNRDKNNQLIINKPIGIKISILQGSASGTPLYVETQKPNTNDNGLISLEIGGGTAVSGKLADIDWAAGPYFIKTETDPTGGTDYTIAGTSQLLSVPYALHAKTADNGLTPELANEIAANTAKVGVTPGTAPGQMQYWNGTEWITVAPGNSGQFLTFENETPTWIYIAATKAGPTDVYNPTTGKIWMDRNLGASQVATSSTDAASYGDLYQWGRGSDGHQKRTSGTTTELATKDAPGHGKFILPQDRSTSPQNPWPVPNPRDWRSPKNDNLWQGVNGINNPCPIGYRVPTSAEWKAEVSSWNTNQAADGFGSPLKLPLSGFRDVFTGNILRENEDGYYWSSTIYLDMSYNLLAGSTDFSTSDYRYRATGLSVRCIKD